MRHWARISRRLPKKSVEANFQLGNAYRSVFRDGSAESQQVLADLAARCGWNQITDPRTASDKEIWFAEGKRAAFGELFAHLSLSPADIAAFDNAVRHEAAALLQQDAEQDY